MSGILPSGFGFYRVNVRVVFCFSVSGRGRRFSPRVLGFRVPDYITSQAGHILSHNCLAFAWNVYVVGRPPKYCFVLAEIRAMETPVTARALILKIVSVQKWTKIMPIGGQD